MACGPREESKDKKPGVPESTTLLQRGPFITGATSFGFTVKGREFAAYLPLSASVVRD